MLVEDHPLNREIAKKLLEKENYKIDCACNGKEGTEMFQRSKENEYALILMDIRMPIMNGIEATKIIRQMNRKDAKSIPILAMTANAYEEDQNITKEAGMNEHLSKPVEPQKLFMALKKYIG